MAAIDIINQVAKNNSSDIDVSDIQDIVYWNLKENGFNPSKLGSKYIELDGQSFQFSRNNKKNNWSVKQF